MDSFSLTPGAFPKKGDTEHCPLGLTNVGKSFTEQQSNLDKMQRSTESPHYVDPTFDSLRENEEKEVIPRFSDVSVGRRSATLFFRDGDRGPQANLYLVLLRGPPECHRRIPLYISPCFSSSSSSALPQQCSVSDSCLRGVVVGRSTSCDVVLDPWLVFASSRHALLSTHCDASSEETSGAEERKEKSDGTEHHTKDHSKLSQRKAISETGEEESFWVTDLGSTNGTFVNKQRLAPMKPYPLHHGDTIIFGGMQDVDGFLDTTAMQRSELVVWRVETPGGAEDERRLFSSLEDDMRVSSVGLDDKAEQEENDKGGDLGRSTVQKEEDGLYEATSLPFRPSEADLDRYASFLLEAALDSTTGCSGGLGGGVMAVGEEEADMENGSSSGQSKNDVEHLACNEVATHVQEKITPPAGGNLPICIQETTSVDVRTAVPGPTEASTMRGGIGRLEANPSSEKSVTQMRAQASSKGPSPLLPLTPSKPSEEFSVSCSSSTAVPHPHSQVFYPSPSSCCAGQLAARGEGISSTEDKEEEGKKSSSILNEHRRVSSGGGMGALASGERTGDISSSKDVSLPHSTTVLPSFSTTDNLGGPFTHEEKFALGRSLSCDFQDVEEGGSPPFLRSDSNQGSPFGVSRFPSPDGDDEEVDGDIEGKDCGPITRLPHLFPVSLASLNSSPVPSSLLVPPRRQQRWRRATHEEGRKKNEEGSTPGSTTDSTSSAVPPPLPSVISPESSNYPTIPSLPVPFCFTHVRLGRWRFSVPTPCCPSQPFLLNEDSTSMRGEVVQEEQESGCVAAKGMTMSSGRKKDHPMKRKRGRNEEMDTTGSTAHERDEEAIAMASNRLSFKNLPFTLSFSPMHWVWCMKPTEASAGVAEVMRCVLPITSIATVLVCPALCGLAVELGAHVKQLPCSVPSTVFSTPESVGNGNDDDRFLRSGISSGNVETKLQASGTNRVKLFSLSALHLHRWIVWYFVPSSTMREDAAPGRGGGGAEDGLPIGTRTTNSTGITEVKLNRISSTHAGIRPMKMRASKQTTLLEHNDECSSSEGGGKEEEKEKGKKRVQFGSGEGISHIVNDDRALCSSSFFPEWVCSIFYFFHGLGLPEPLCVDESTFSFLINE